MLIRTNQSIFPLRNLKFLNIDNTVLLLVYQDGLTVPSATGSV
ncbi:hypothetical protein BN903_32 [Halorubrum sp. AJ67]|nr:hypothetical protein BN903_32 [Halorubrum sp. AJ67]